MGKAASPLGVIILAAGRGTRMRSERAKVLHTVAGKPFVLSVLDAALTLEPERIAVVVGHEADKVQGACAEHLAGRGAAPPVFYPVQREQHGTGDAARAAVPAFEGFAGDLLILYGDVPALTPATLTGLVAHHRQTGAALSLLTATFEDARGYGRIRRQADGGIAGVVEERDLAPAERDIHEVNPGIYCASAQFLLPALARLQADNAQREYYLTDVVSMAVTDGLPVATLAVANLQEVAGINSRKEMASMEERARRALVEHWMQAGVTFRDPPTAYLEERVTIGADSEIGPNVQLLGRTTIGRGCRIDGTAFLCDATIGDRVHVRLGVVMTECRIGDDVVIGPFAHLRPGTELAAGVHVGNFVETKNAHLGAGTKANHLTYLGDVEVGDHTNIGAGTITCNYDGFAKHRTVIGNRVQIGSDTQLVAPVTVADDAYVAAGTTVTHDVPAGHLVLSRVPQRTVAGWVERRRAKVSGTPGQASPVRPAETATPVKRATIPPRAIGRAKAPRAKRKTVRPPARQPARVKSGRRGKR
jgi:bifunctional UDP-N-acetylglucosamine pyrophosphorylase/glucosamine-1-phosphate N-acetyltransferase